MSNNWLIRDSIHQFMYTLTRLNSNNITMAEVLDMMIEDATQTEEVNLKALDELANHIGFEIQDRNLDWEGCPNDYWSRG